MRPAQLTPENDAFLFDEGERASHASMRPAQLTPENEQGLPAVLAVGVASMRPAQLTPENPSRFRAAGPSPSRFNEAGAINAGKQRERGSEAQLEIGLQ